MATAQTLINSALRKLGVLASGETPDANTSTDALDTLNRMLEGWRLEGLMAYAITTLETAWASGLAYKTIGPSATINTTRPVRIDTAVWVDSGGNVYDMDVITPDEWLHCDPANLSGIPQGVYYDSTHPQATIRLWPVPDLAGTLKTQVRTPVTAYALSDTVSLPPGYERAMVYGLALEIAPEHGMEPPQSIVALASDAKADIKRNNIKMPVLGMPYGLTNRHKSDITRGY